MRAAIHIKNHTSEHLEGKLALVEALHRRGVEVIDKWTPDTPIDIIISIGGDGTLLSAVHQTGGSGVPIVGINFGHLGFLTTAGRDDIEKLAECLTTGSYSIEQRTMLEVKTSGSTLYALNEVYLHRLDQSPLLHTQVEVDGYMVATYAADGLIVATPTGSTAYSLSAGGPIIAPNAKNFVITPIATHNLTVRPVVIPDDSTIRIQVEGREKKFVFSMDSRSCTLDTSVQLKVRKADFCLNLVRMRGEDFFSTIRNKLMWGKDNRN